MAQANGDNKQKKLILLTDMEGNANILISGNAQHSIAPKFSIPEIRGIRSSRDRTKMFVDDNRERIPVDELITCNNLDLGVGKRLTVKYGLVGHRLFYRILGVEFVEANGLIVDYERKTITNPGPNGRTVTGIGLTPDIIEEMYPKDGVVILQDNDYRGPLMETRVAYDVFEDEEYDIAETAV